MTITQYLGKGTTSRGRTDITPQLNMRVATQPYLRDAADEEAVIAGIDYVRTALANVQGLSWITPTSGQTTTAFVNSVSRELIVYLIYKQILTLILDPRHVCFARFQPLDWQLHHGS